MSEARNLSPEKFGDHQVDIPQCGRGDDTYGCGGAGNQEDDEPDEVLTEDPEADSGPQPHADSDLEPRMRAQLLQNQPDDVV